MPELTAPGRRPIRRNANNGTDRGDGRRKRPEQKVHAARNQQQPQSRRQTVRHIGTQRNAQTVPDSALVQEWNLPQGFAPLHLTISMEAGVLEESPNTITTSPC